MPGLKLSLPVSVTDLSLPLLKDDPILTPGSMTLMEFINEPSGVPTNNAPLTNIAKKELAGVLGIPVASVGRPVFDNTAQAIDAKIERSGKGGLHYSPNRGGTNIGRGLFLNVGLQEKQFILDNPMHEYYMSGWVRQTRQTLSPSSGGAIHIFKLAGRSDWTRALKMVWYSGSWFIANPPYNGTPTPSATVAQPKSTFQTIPANGAGLNRMSAGSAPGWAAGSSTLGMVVPSAADLDAGYGFGTRGTSQNAVNIPSLGSFIFYRLYLEDLTLSGRTYAQVDAIDAAEYAKAFGVGGRYYNDTFTDPATITF